MTIRVAVVTGGNKGIGLEIVRVLCRQLGDGGVVYLTARNESRGQQAVELLGKEGLAPKFHILDVMDTGTISRFRDYIKKTHGGLDILVNNAGIGTPPDLSSHDQAQTVLATNFTGLLEVSQSLIPLLRSGGRVVHLASTTAHMAFLQLGDKVKARFRQVSSEQDVIDLMSDFLKVQKAGTIAQEGWMEWSYGISKLGVVSLATMQAQEISKDSSRQDILINSCCPGFVHTDMTANLSDDFYGGKKVSIVEGADTPVYLATLPAGSTEPHGKFLLRRQVYDFINSDMEIQI
ncbi:carbonyl reductase [NADPH] 1-like [Diadema antillarum]|uniref:carbonyl reductase [NADPH] 1-like n=1 Tax=Diadema antillarum TaxID=105358 RepID=UPI003A8513BF